MTIINTLYFDDYEDFVDAISIKYEKIKEYDDLNSVDIVARYDDAKEIIRELIGIGYGIAFITDFADPEYDGYDEEFIISLFDNEIWVEPAKRDGKYVYVETNVAYILENCNSKVISMTEEVDEVFEVEIGDEYECDCENCELNTASTASYSVNGKEVSKEEYEDKMAELDVAFRKHMDTMLDDYSDFVNEMNNWRKLFEW